MPERDATQSTTPDARTPGLKIGPAHVVACLLLALLFLVANFRPLYYSDLWGHVAYGQWIIQNGRIPAEDPFAPLVAGEKIIASAWLAQVLLGAVANVGGAEWLSHVYALTIALVAVFIGFALSIRSRSTWLAVAGTTLVVIIGWFRIAVIRPEMFGMLCFALLLLCTALLERHLAEEKPLRARWLLFAVIAVTFVVWVNCHGSFLVGIVFLGTLLVGRAGEVLWRQRNLKALVADASLRCWLFALLLATGGSLANPYGVGLIVNSLTFGRIPNLQDMNEWSPMAWGLLHSYYLLFCTLAFLMVAVVNRRQLRLTDVLLMLIFSIIFLRYVRMGFWYVVVFAYVITPLVGKLLPSRTPGESSSENAELQQRRQKQTQIMGLVCLVILAAVFTLSPLGRSILGRTPRTPQRLLAYGTPLGATNFLHEHPPAGQIYNPQWWGDWLAWAGPPDLQVFLTTNTVHVAPHQLWKDYVGVSRLEPGWQQTLEKYNVTTIISDKHGMSGLSAEIRQLPGFHIVYEDDVAIIVSKEELTSPDGDPAESLGN